MSYFCNPRRMRGDTTVAKRPFTFRNNAGPSIQHRFVAPAKPFANYGMRGGIRTPMLMHGGVPSAYSPYENAYICRDEGYASAMEIEDPDVWGDEVLLEMENNFDVVEDNYMKRKNNFAYPEREYMQLPQNKRVANPRVLASQENNRVLASESLKCVPPKRQAVLVADIPKGLGFKLEKIEKSVAESVKENSSPKIYPKWNPSDSSLKMKPKVDNKNSTFPRIFTVTVEKLLNWRKALTSGEMIFELYGILDKVLDVKFPKGKKLQIKSQNMRSSLICNFYEIDRPLPAVVLGQWYRCIVLWRQSNAYQCVTIRSASANELKNLDKWAVSSSKSMAVILKSM